MAKKREPCTTDANPATPWKGRLRSHHATPPTLPSSSSTKNHKKRELEAAKSFNKRAAPNKANNTGKCGSRSVEKRPQQSAPPRRSPCLTGNPPAFVDGACKESKVRGNRSAITPFRRSLQLHRNQNNQNSLSMHQNHENSSRSQQNTVVKLSTRMASHKDSQKLFCQDYQDIPPRTKVIGLSREKTEKEELNSNCCQKLARKRKRGTEGGMSSSKGQSHQKPKPLPVECQEIARTDKPRNTNHKKSENNYSSMAQPKFCDERLMNAERNNKELDGSERGETQCGLHNWTEEQDMALHKAYFTARPSPNFWKKVSKMVPGKSAEECLNKIHADLSTPTPIAPRPRKSKMNFSPLGHFTLSDPKHQNVLEPSFRRQTAKQKSLTAQKTVRHLLRKHCLTDQTQEADHFSIFETSPTILPLDFSFEDSPGTPDGAGKKMLPKLETVKNVGINSAKPSPAVLKPVKNVILHEKYVDRLSRREGTKRPRKEAAAPKTLDSVKTQQAGDLKAARNALITEATDFISHFKKMQANPLAHVVEDDEDDEIDDIECDISNH